MPKWNWSPDKVVFMDLETQSSANLRKEGSKRYIEHPSTRIMSAVFLLESSVVVWVPPGRAPDLGKLTVSELWPAEYVRDCELVLWQGESPPLNVMLAPSAGYTFVAHNAVGFDAKVWQRNFPDDEQPEWFDTVYPCRAGGLPAGLAAVGQALFGIGKDSGRDSMLLLSKANESAKGPVYYPGTVYSWREMLRYNVADVLLLRKVYQSVKRFTDPRICAVDREVNERGFNVSLLFAQTLAKLWEENTKAAKAKCVQLSGDELSEADIRSPAKVKAWLKRHGLEVKSLERKQIEQMVWDPESFFGTTEDPNVNRVRALLEARVSANRNTQGKVDRVKDFADFDGRLRDQVVYHGAHTGRWSGKGIQPHNMPKGDARVNVEKLLSFYELDTLDYQAVQEESDRVGCTVDDCLATLFRPIVCAPAGKKLLILDYGSVECRGLAWLARQENLLELFADPKGDPYCLMASKVFGRRITKADKRERDIGKIIVLGCGYGMSAARFDYFCRLNKIDLAEAGTSAQACVEAFRDEFSAIAGAKQGAWRRYGIWQTYHAAAKAAVEATDSKYAKIAGRVMFERRGPDMVLTLPSNRELYYRRVRIEKRAAPWGGPEIDAMCYDKPHGAAGVIYGGLLTENVVQAICRDLLADAMARLSKLVVLHVHDELILEVAEDKASSLLKLAAEVMSSPPEWAQGFPVRVEGFSGTRYTKSPLYDSDKVDALNGEIL